MTWIASDFDERPTPGDWIVERLDELRESLRERDRRFAELKPWEFLDPEPVYAAVRLGRFDDAVAIICDKYGIDSSRVRLTWVDDVKDPRVAAHVHSEPFGAVEITILAKYQIEPAAFGTVIAHELGHAYLTDLDIPNGGGWEEEALTDLVTFVKGLGKLTVNGVEYLGYSQKAGSRGYGYLSREAVVFAYARVAEEFDLTDETAKAGLNSAALSYLRTLLEPAKSGCLVLLAIVAAALGH